MSGFNAEVNKFINKNLTLNQKDISSAVASREWLINKIINKISEKTDCPQLYSEKGAKYIQFGSYFKGTKVANVDEFDIMLIIDSKGGQFTKNGNILGNGIGNVSPNPKYNKKFYKENEDVISSRKLLTWLKDIVDEVLKPYGCIPSERDGQAITAYIKSKNLHIDFVPGCIFQRAGTYGDDGVFYIIPKGDINCGWIETNPRIDKKIISDISEIHSQFKNTIRLFKYLLKNSYKVKISSYAVESALVSYYKQSLFFDNFDYDFILFLLHLISLVENEKIPDMRDSEINLLDISNKEVILKKLNIIKDKYYSLDENSITYSENVEEFLKNE